MSSSDLQSNFEQTAASIKEWKPTNGQPTNDEKLTLYALYKQATEGDCNTKRSGMFDLTGKAKWDAWNGKKGTSKEDAMKQYIAEVERQKSVYGS